MAIDGHPQQSTAGTASTAVLATIGHDAEDTDRPDWRDPVSVAHQDLWMRCREAYEGTDALLANARRYLPKHKKEKAEDYNARVAHSAAFNAYGITITGLLGLAFAKEPTLGADVPRQLKAHAENIDGRGTPLALFARNLAEEGMVVGSAGFMVLYPPRPADATARDEHEGVLRPYWAPILIEDVYSWDYQTVGAREVMTQLVVREFTRKRKGRFGFERVTRFREFRRDVEMLGLAAPVEFAVWEERKTTTAGSTVTELVPIESGVLTNGVGAPFSRIPFVPTILGRATSPVTARPPLKDLLDIMLKAFRIDSDRTFLMHQACVPIPVRKGYVSPQRAAMLGDSQGQMAPAARTGGGAAAPNVLMDLPADTKDFSGASFGWAEITGSAFAPTKDEMEKLKAEMGALGMAFLAPSTRAAETADARRLDARIENASLASSMSRLESVIEEGLILHAEYLGLAITKDSEKSGGSFTVNRDYERTVLSDAAITTYSNLVLADQLTLETFYAILQQGRALPDGFDAKKEVAQLALMSFDGSAKAAEIPPTRPADPTSGQLADPEVEDTTPPSV